MIKIIPTLLSLLLAGAGSVAVIHDTSDVKVASISQASLTSPSAQLQVSQDSDLFLSADGTSNL